MLIGRTEATTWATCFQALGDPSRILILHLLATAGRPMRVGEITGALDIGPSAAARALKQLAHGRRVKL